MLEACGFGEIPGDPEAVRAIADALERGSREAEQIADLIRAARSTALSGWDAASAEGYAAFCDQALTCAHGLIDIGPAAAGPLRAYADELEAAQRAFAAARQKADSAERERDTAERGSREEHSAEEALGDAKLALGNAREAALEANERAARAIDAVADGVPAAPAAPVPPPMPAASGPREDTGFLDYLANDFGGDLKGAFGTDLGFGDPDSQTYQEGQEFYSRPVPKLAVNLLGPTKLKLAGQGVLRGGQAVVAGARAIPGVADDAAKAAAGAAAATAAALGGWVLAQRGKQKKTETDLEEASDEEVRRRVEDKSLSKNERRKAIKEEKSRKLRNKQKRNK